MNNLHKTNETDQPETIAETNCPECERLRKKLKLYKDAETLFEWVVDTAEDEESLIEYIICWIRTRQFKGIDRFVGLDEYYAAREAGPGGVSNGGYEGQAILKTFSQFLVNRLSVTQRLFKLTKI